MQQTAENKNPQSTSEVRRLIHKTSWIDTFEARLAQQINIHPNVISGIKLFLVAPLLILALKQIDTLPNSPLIVISLLTIFGLLDYLDGTVAKYSGRTTAFGRIFDRVTDYPIILIVSYFCIDTLPVYLLALKLIFDLVLLVLYIVKREHTENRLRNGLNYTILFSLVMLSQGWMPRFITHELVISLLVINVTFTFIVVLYTLRILQKRFIADALSGANLLCGIFSMIFASNGRFDISLLFLMLGAAFDGFDGAAARKFGGTRWGVYSDDVADGVNYGIAPGVALYFALQGLEGIVAGILYSTFTISRLVFFTLNKSYGDPNYFCGVPSTVGGIVTLCALIIFKEYQALIGLMVGIACIQMVSFDTHYKHLGRALSSNRRIIYGMPFLIALLIFGNHFWGRIVPVAIIFAASLLYGFIPMLTHFKRLIQANLHKN